MRFITRFFLLVCLLALIVTARLAAAQDDASAIAARVNDLRASLGLASYAVNGALNAAAQQHAQWIAQTGSVSHTQSDGSGPRTRALNAGYPSTEVTENIYGGTQATVDVAWGFWVNSGVHYRGMTHPGYQDIGVGVARSDWGTAYVVLFGNPGGPPPAPPGAGDGAGGAVGEGGAPPPVYVVGVDERGNIMHEIQPDDTIGDIALIYGYTWDDIPDLMALNGVADVRDLDIGAVFLVPPHDGTYTPTPEPQIPPTNTRAVTEAPDETDQTDETDESDESDESTNTPVPTNTPTETPTIPPIATAGEVPESVLIAAEATPQVVAAAVTDSPATALAPVTGSVTVIRSGRSPWLLIAVLVQAGIILAAGFEFFRRRRR